MFIYPINFWYVSNDFSSVQRNSNLDVCVSVYVWFYCVRLSVYVCVLGMVLLAFV